MKPLILITLICFLTGCSATYQRIDVTDQPQEKIPRNSKILISTPDDGQYANKKYEGSGRMTSLEMSAAFKRYSNQVDVTTNCSTTAKCLLEAERSGYVYLIFPEILHWEDRATEWSGKPDRIEVKISTYKVQSKFEIHSTIIAGKGKWFILGGDHPQDLLSEPIANYISTLH
jgi:hypothetical protein